MVLNIILIVINIPLFLYSAYFLVFLIIGLLKKKRRFPETEKRTHFAVLVPARNEESVIGALMESIQKLDYPRECFDTYVLLHNCTDDTEEIVSRYGAKILRRGPELKSKGEVLRSVFDELSAHEEIDAYVIVDADNAMNPEFLREVNKAIVGGASVVQCRRTGRNSKDAWVAGCYEIYYRMQNAFYNRPRIGIGCSASINGSGWAVTKDLISRNGFEVRTITEDMEYTVICALDNARIAYVNEAISSDQFVSRLKLSMTQRVRWSYGMFQCIKYYEGNLIKQAFKGSYEAFDLALVNLMMIMTALSVALIPTGFFSVREILPLDQILPISPWLWFLIYLGLAAISYYLGSCIAGLIAVLMTRGSLRENWKGILGFPIFLVTWIPVIISCLFRRRVDWTPMRKSKGRQ